MDYLKEFVIGGSVIAGSKLVSKLFGPTFAPIIGGMPTGIIASYFLSNDTQKQDFFKGYSVSSPILALTVIAIYFLSIYVKQFSINTISTIGLLLWGILSLVSMHFIT